jgi:diguanylate cyclase (GGDEF)-like protein
LEDAQAVEWGSSKKWRAWVLAVSLALALAWGLAAGRTVFGAPAALDNLFLDAFQRAFASGRPAHEVVVVDIDDASLAGAGQWPWPRYRIAALVQKIADRKAAAIGLDVLFPEPDASSLDNIQKTYEKDFGARLVVTGVPDGLRDNDAYFGGVLARSGAVGARYLYFDYRSGLEPHASAEFSFTGRTDLLSLDDAPGLLDNTGKISTQLRFTGFLNSAPDSDGILRRFPLLMRHAGTIYPNLALATFMRSLGTSTAAIQSTRGGLVIHVGNHLVPINEMGYALPAWSGRAYLYPSVSAIDVLNGAAANRALEGKIVLIGSSAAALHDVHSTVFDYQFPGLMVQAAAVEDLATDRFLREPAWSWVAILAGCSGAGLLLALLFIRARDPLRLFAGAALLLGGFAAVSAYLFAARGIFVSPAAPVLAGAFLFILLAAARFAVEKRQADEAIRSLAAERRSNETRVHRLAYFDSLTELPNRQFFLEKIDREISLARRHGGKLGILFMDLDGFKNINDTMGHAIGDQCLTLTASRLRLGLRPSDDLSRAAPAGADSPLARLGGDEFTALLRDVARPDDVWSVANRLRELMQQPLLIEEREILLTASIGIAMYPDDGVDSNTLLKHADTAMYHAKSQGRNNCQFYSASLTQQAERRMNLANDLRHALERNELQLLYQPQVSASSGRITSMEALIRWQHPRDGTISPREFIPLAEESGLIVPIGEWVLRTACAAAARWNADGHATQVAVNLSPIQFRSANLLRAVRGSLDASGLPAQCLELEITEGAVMQDDGQTLETLLALREAGVMIALDDFGTGYSSMNYLKRMPLSKIKVDRTFVSGLPSDTEDMVIIRAILSMAGSLGLTATAEGVETVEQARSLLALGCDLLQGFYYSEPVPASQIPALLARYWPIEHAA